MIQNHGYIVLIKADESNLCNLSTIELDGKTVLPVFRTIEEAKSMNTEYTDKEIKIAKLDFVLEIL